MLVRKPSLYGGGQFRFHKTRSIMAEANSGPQVHHGGAKSGSVKPISCGGGQFCFRKIQSIMAELMLFRKKNIYSL